MTLDDFLDLAVTLDDFLDLALQTNEQTNKQTCGLTMLTLESLRD